MLREILISRSHPPPPQKEAEKSLKKKKKKGYNDNNFVEEDDGTQAWCIVMSCFFVNTIIMGYLKSLGMLMIELKKTFSATPTHVSILVSITLALNCVAGPLACYLSVAWSARTVAFIGTSFVSLGLIISYFANSMTYLYVSLGVLGGFGSGLTYSPGMILIGTYFKQANLGMANGIVVTGGPIGGIVMPYVFNFLVRYLGVRGALLILGGVMMNTVVCTLSYRPYRKSAKRFWGRTCSSTQFDDTLTQLRRTSASACIRHNRDLNPDSVSNAGDYKRDEETSDDGSSGPEFIDYEGSNPHLVKSQSGHGSTGSSVFVYKVNERYGQKSRVRKSGDDASETLSKPPYWNGSSDGQRRPQDSSKPSKNKETAPGDLPEEPNALSIPDVIQGQQIEKKASQTKIHSTKVTIHPFASGIRQNSREQKVDATTSPIISRTDNPEGTTSNSGRLLGSSKDFQMSQSSRLGSSHTGTGLRHRRPRHDLIPPNKRRDLQAASAKKLPPYILSLDHSCVIMISNDDFTKGHRETTDLASSKAAILRASNNNQLLQDIGTRSGPTGDHLEGGSQLTQTCSKNKVPQSSALPSGDHPHPKRSCCSRITTWIRNSPLSNCAFLILLFSNGSTAIATMNILLLIPALVQSLGLSKADCSTIYLIISLCDLVARLTGAVLFNKGFVTAQSVFATGLLIAGISSCIIAFVTSFWSICLFTGMFGFACGLHIGIYGTLLTQTVGVELLHVGYALSMSLNGILQFSFIYISGRVLSANQDAYTPLYVFYGSCLLVGSSLWLIPLVVWIKHNFQCRCSKQRTQDKDNNNVLQSSKSEEIYHDEDFERDSTISPSSPKVRSLHHMAGIQTGSSTQINYNQTNTTTPSPSSGVVTGVSK